MSRQWSAVRLLLGWRWLISLASRATFIAKSQNSQILAVLIDGESLAHHGVLPPPAPICGIVAMQCPCQSLWHRRDLKFCQCLPGTQTPAEALRGENKTFLEFWPSFSICVLLKWRHFPKRHGAWLWTPHYLVVRNSMSLFAFPSASAAVPTSSASWVICGRFPLLPPRLMLDEVELELRPESSTGDGWSSRRKSKPPGERRRSRWSVSGRVLNEVRRWAYGSVYLRTFFGEKHLTLAMATIKQDWQSLCAYGIIALPCKPECGLVIGLRLAMFYSGILIDLCAKEKVCVCACTRVQADEQFPYTFGPNRVVHKLFLGIRLLKHMRWHHFWGYKDLMADEQIIYNIFEWLCPELWMWVY